MKLIVTERWDIGISWSFRMWKCCWWPYSGTFRMFYMVHLGPLRIWYKLPTDEVMASYRKAKEEAKSE